MDSNRRGLCRPPGDADGAPTWNNLLADLRDVLLRARPDVIVLPHPTLDPHPDHICAQEAVLEALRGLDYQPTLLGYANHLHDNDRWPMGEPYSAGASGNPPIEELEKEVSAAGLADLNDKFADVLRRGAIVQSKALPQERNEPEILSLPRLVLTPHRRSFGRFRQLIDAINRSECV